jgi:hypothetical protein
MRPSSSCSNSVCAALAKRLLVRATCVRHVLCPRSIKANPRLPQLRFRFRKPEEGMVPGTVTRALPALLQELRARASSATPASS